MDKINSLKNSREFSAVYKARRSRANTLLVMYVLNNGLDCSRLGISISRKVGNSVLRHRLTRLIRQVFRLDSDRIMSGIDIVVVVRRGGDRSCLKALKFADVEKSVLHLANLHKVLID